MLNVSGIVFEDSKVTGKVYQYVCQSCESLYWKHPSETLFWTEYVLSYPCVKDHILACSPEYLLTLLRGGQVS